MAPLIVLVTGSSAGGIGGCLVEQFAQRGCIVYASARRLESLQALEQPTSPTPHASNVTQKGEIRNILMDVNSDESVQGAIQTIIGEAGRIDILVNNAGVLAVGPLLDVAVNEVASAYNTNVLSILRVCQAVVPHMASQKSGLVINIGSITAVVPIPFGGVYASTKAAVRSLSETMLSEYGPFGVKVQLIEPGGIRSNLSTNYAARYVPPPNSLYKRFTSAIEGRIHVSQSPGAMDTTEFARYVVERALPPPERSLINPLSFILGRKRAWDPTWYISIGANASLFKFLAWLPRRFVLRRAWQGAQKMKAPPKVDVAPAS